MATTRTAHAVWNSDLMSGSGTEFQERGEHTLKGIPGTWTLYAANL